MYMHLFLRGDPPSERISPMRKLISLLVVLVPSCEENRRRRRLMPAERPSTLPSVAFEFPMTVYKALFISSSTERAMRLLRSELQPPLAWRRTPRGWRPRLRPCGCWLVSHTNVRGRG